VYDNIENNFENILGQNWLGFISLIILSLIFIFSYKSKNKKLEMFVMILLIFSTIWFYASITSEERAEKGVPGRYVLPVFVLSSMIFGYGIERVFVNIRNKKWKRSKIFQLSLVSVLLVFVIISYYFTPSVTMLGQESYFKNPYDYKREFPLKENGINEKSIVVTSIGVRALEYNLIPFNPSSNKIITNESIESLNLLVKDYDVFVFKTPYNNNEIKTVSELEKKGFVFIDYSENFCSMETDIELLKSQKKCIFNKSIR